MMNTPNKNRISNVEDSPVYKYINDLSPIEPVRGVLRAESNIFHSLASSSPSALFSSPQINGYRDSRFSIKRHRSLDLSSPVGLLCVGNVSETKRFNEHINLAIELANTLKNGCDIQMVSCDQVPMDAQVGSVGSRKESGACIQNSEQDEPKTMDCGFNSFTSLCFNNSGNVVESGGSYNVQVATGATDMARSSLSKAEDKEEIGVQPFRKRRSVRRRRLTFDVGGSYNRKPLRDSTNDLPLGCTSTNKVLNPQMSLDSIKQKTDEIPPLPQTIGLRSNGLVNPSASSDRLIYKDGVFSTHVSTKSYLVSYDNKIMEKAPERPMEGEYFEELSTCKRCRCRKSKCLKLYCECFAAGLYCVEPCACENCFNKPILEDLVMKVRKEIEARNPLAFAPKLVSTSDFPTGFGDENSKTPASARHTRGCNCKKSSCLKKYCECFLMGVGCSPSCGCVGCRNIVGHTNEQFQFSSAVGSNVTAINEQA